jgi:hypothetical protein
MAQFVADEELVSALSSIIKDAREELILISPYIKLHDRIKDDLKNKKEDLDLKVIVVFGKNDDDLTKSLSTADLGFFTALPNIEIRYKKNLHAKYYANEKNALITSMNLHSYSSNSNKEAGILTKTPGLLKSLIKTGNSIDEDAYKYFANLLDSSNLFFLKEPEFEEKNFGFSVKHIGFKVDDHLPQCYKKTRNGYCIRTGVEIPFNPKQPYSSSAYESWAKYKNSDYKEKFCHKTGKPSDGKTSMKSPILF